MSHFIDLSPTIGNPICLEMKAFFKELRHAFAVEPVAGEEMPLPAALERFAEETVQRGMETPAILLLETGRPLSFLASQVMFAVSPLMRMVTKGGTLNDVAEAMTDRRTVEHLISRIETLARNRGEDA